MTAYPKAMSVAFGLSLGAHLLLGAAWELADLGWLPSMKILAQQILLRSAAPDPHNLVRQPPARPEEIAKLIFVETDARGEKPDADKKTPYYGARSSRAANPNPDAAREGDTPYLEGKEKRMMATANAPLPHPGAESSLHTPPQPRAAALIPPEPKEGVTAPDKKPTSPTEVRALQNRDRSPRPAQIEPPQATRAEQPPAEGGAPQQQARLSERKLPSRLSEQRQTAAPRRGKVALDVQGTLFGAYDERLTAAVARRWYALVQRYEYGERTGMVEIFFKLHADGRISGMEVQQNTAGEVLAQYCKKAIDDSAPFEPFPDELRQLLAKDYREIYFIFYY